MKEATPDKIDWANASGDIWAERWRETDRGLAPLHPYLVSAVVDRAPKGPFRAFDVGCGPGSTSIAIAQACPDASIIACDISSALAEIARQRTAGTGRVRTIVGDAETIAPNEGPFDLVFSRHGVMFFDDPVRAFQNLRASARQGASLVFSCFQDWELNPWASELASAAAGKVLPSPGRESGGFAFADPDYVLDILRLSAWAGAERESVQFRYVAAEGERAVADALSFMTDIGPASRVLQALPDEERSEALNRMRNVIQRRFDRREVAFPAAAWVWSATAA